MINAVLSIWRDLKTSVADTLKASLCVDTAAVATHHSIHNTLINVNAGLFGGGSLVALMALAVVGSRCVDTVSIDTGITHTLIHIDTLPTNVLSVAHVALAAVACGCGNAASVQTQVGEMFAHVDGVVHRNWADSLVRQKSSSIAPKASSVASKASSSVATDASSVTVAIWWELVSIVEAVAIGAGEVSVGVREALGNTHNAQTPELIRPPDRTHLRDLSQSPAASRVAAALHLGELTGQLCSTAAICQSRETSAHTLIHTSGAVCAGDVASWTGAHIATSSVGALASITHARDGAAFVDIFTFVGGFTLAVAGRTFTLVGSHSVDAVTSSTKTRYSLTLVHILTGSGANVGDEASPAGVRLGRALLTRVAPSSTNGGTAEGFGAHDSTELALTHLVVHLGETWPSPVVSLALRASETVDTGTSVGSDAAPTVLAAILTHRLSTVAACVALRAGARIF